MLLFYSKSTTFDYISTPLLKILKKCMLKEQIVVLKTLKLSSKTVFSISDSLVVFRKKIKQFVRLDYML